MRRAVLAVLSAVILGTSLSLEVARADRPDSGQSNDPTPAPTPTPEPTYVPTPTPTGAPTTVIAPTVNAGSTIVINPPGGGYPPPTMMGPGGNIVTPAGVPIVIRNEVQTEHRLLSIDGMVLGSCFGNCTFQVPPGSYIIEMRETEAYRSGRKKIIVTGPTMVDVSPGSKSKKNTGLVLGSVGAGLFLVGFFGTIFVAAHNSTVDSECRVFGDCTETKTNIAPYVIALVAGIGGTVTGFVMFGTSGTKLQTTAYAPSVSFAPLAWKDGAGGGFKIAF